MLALQINPREVNMTNRKPPRAPEQPDQRPTPPTMGERYSLATDSSDLTLRARRGDVDLIIAAGLLTNPLGAAMHRLLVEYDAVRAEHLAAANRLASSEAMAARQTGDDAELRAAAIMAAAQATALTSHLLILAQLSSLHAAKGMFCAWAIQQATKSRFMRPNAEVAIISGQVLDVYLRPQCPDCAGRGFNGGEHRGATTTKCRTCKGTKTRLVHIGRDDQQRWFAARLLVKTDELMATMQRDLRRALNVMQSGKDRISEALAQEQH